MNKNRNAKEILTMQGNEYICQYEQRRHGIQWTNKVIGVMDVVAVVI